MTEDALAKRTELEARVQRGKEELNHFYSQVAEGEQTLGSFARDAAFLLSRHPLKPADFDEATTAAGIDEFRGQLQGQIGEWVFAMESTTDEVGHLVSLQVRMGLLSGVILGFGPPSIKLEFEQHPSRGPHADLLGSTERECLGIESERISILMPQSIDFPLASMLKLPSLLNGYSVQTPDLSILRSLPLSTERSVKYCIAPREHQPRERITVRHKLLLGWLALWEELTGDSALHKFGLHGRREIIPAMALIAARLGLSLPSSPEIASAIAFLMHGRRDDLKRAKANLLKLREEIQELNSTLKDRQGRALKIEQALKVPLMAELEAFFGHYAKEAETSDEALPAT